jgi:hypothetical protein
VLDYTGPESDPSQSQLQRQKRSNRFDLARDRAPGKCVSCWCVAATLVAQAYGMGRDTQGLVGAMIPYPLSGRASTTGSPAGVGAPELRAEQSLSSASRSNASFETSPPRAMYCSPPTLISSSLAFVYVSSHFCSLD